MQRDVAGFEWDAGKREKRRKHGVSVGTIKTPFTRPMAVFPDLKHATAETRFIGIGKANNGGHVLVVFTLREGDDGVLIRPVSARYMHKKEIEHYEKEAAKTRK